MKTRRRTLLLFALLVQASAATLIAQTLPPLATNAGQFVSERRGAAVADAGDLNADGRADFWVSSPFDSSAGLQRGAVRAISGLDGSVFYTIYGAAAVDHFGWSLARLGDLNGDGIGELVVGSPDNDFQAQDAGALRVASGANGATLFSVYGFVPGAGLGASVCAAGDLDGDGRADFHAGAPFDSSVGPLAGCVDSYSGAGGALLARKFGAQAGDRLGIAVANGADLDLDGRPELLAGADQPNLDTGYVLVCSGRTGATLRTLFGSARGERFGCALAGGLDIDGDSTPDIAVGASLATLNHTATGAVRVFSGLLGTQYFSVFGAGPGESFGCSVDMLPDLDGDGLAELGVGGAIEAGAYGAAGVVRAISSRTQRPYQVWRGKSGGDRFGAALCAFPDCDGDGNGDLLVGAPRDDTPLVDSGAAFVLSTRRLEAQPYCSAKLNSQGCLPHLSGSGFASTSGLATLKLAAGDVLNHKAGLFLFSCTRGSSPFMGGTLCLAAPIQRSAVAHSGGNSTGADCSGVLRLDLDANALSLHAWSTGQFIHAQAWYRDPQHPDGTASGLSDALEFTIWI